MLSISGLGWATGQQRVLQGLSVDVEPGGCLAIVGPNGAGKTSLLRCCLGWIAPTEGKVTIQDRPIADLGPRERAAQLAWLPQRGQMAESLPVVEVVANARFRFSESRAQSLEAAKRALDAFQLAGFAYRSWHTLSGGEAQRANLASLFAQEAKVWLLDEPANHLDPAIQQDLYGQLHTHWRQGQTTVLITHDLNLLLTAVPVDQQRDVQVLGMKNGHQSFLSALDAPELPDQLGQLYGVTVQEVDVFGRRHWVFGGAT